MDTKISENFIVDAYEGLFAVNVVVKEGNNWADAKLTQENGENTFHVPAGAKCGVKIRNGHAMLRSAFITTFGAVNPWKTPGQPHMSWGTHIPLAGDNCDIIEFTNGVGLGDVARYGLVAPDDIPFKVRIWRELTTQENFPQAVKDADFDLEAHKAKYGERMKKYEKGLAISNRENRPLDVESAAYHFDFRIKTI